MKAILAAFPLLWTVSAASAGGLDCTFSNGPIEGVHDGNMYFRGGAAPARITVAHIDTGNTLQIRAGGVPASDGTPTAFAGYASTDGLVNIMAVNRFVVFMASSEGRCTGMDAERAKPVTQAHHPSGVSDFLRFGNVDCVTDGVHTGIRRLAYNVVETAEGAPGMRIYVFRQQKDPEVTEFTVSDGDGPAVAKGFAFWNRGVVVFAPPDHKGGADLEHVDICR
ncbi:hypothetical protein [Bradyrhizobium sp. 62B]|uniref:hypothetical protein n=1 Tax=Bradyrhizobium sp. 62B TaxID=2898442 RepID=UPI00255824A0